MSQSSELAHEVGENLRENVYNAMKKIAEGFLNWPDNHINRANSDELNEVRKNCITLLYRLLFIHYAESLDLLNIRNTTYRDQFSLNKIKMAVAEKIDKRVSFALNSTELSNKLTDLFDLIFSGSELIKKKFGITDVTFRIAPYQGGLFNPSLNPKLDSWKITDGYIAKAIDLVSRTLNDKHILLFIDYSMLPIQYLGHIYEGLLEYQLKIASEKKVVYTKQNGAAVWIPFVNYTQESGTSKKFIDFTEFERVDRGEPYLSSENEERNISGSFYSPQDLVRKLTEKTLDPIINAKKKYALTHNQSVKDALLSIKILDPAMGSGHFLFDAIEYLASQLLIAIQEDNPQVNKDNRIYSINWAKRQVLSHCIYGVDINNLAVELAKLSLWLGTVNGDQPLNFLDHRLRNGNTIVGIDNTNLISLTLDLKILNSEDFFINYITQIHEIEKLEDNELENIKKKEQIFNNFERSKEKSKLFIFANAFVSKYFAAAPLKNEIDEFIKKVKLYTNDQFQTILSDVTYQKILEIVRTEHIFHWQLEFPEIFLINLSFDGINAAGFDIVVGNPPWGIKFSDKEKKYLVHTFESVNDYESFQYFIVKSIQLTKTNGIHAFIVPNTMPLNVLAFKFRSEILENGCLLDIDDFSEIPKFEDPSVRCITFTYWKNLKPEQLCSFVRYDDTGKKVLERKVLNSILKVTRNWTKFLKCDDIMLPIVEKIEKMSIMLGDITDSKQGYIPYRFSTLKKRFGVEKAKSIKNNREWHSKTQNEPDYWRELQGGDIGRFSLQWSGVWAKYGPHVSTYVDPIYFTKPRLLFREITNKLPYCLYVTYSDEKFINNPGIIGAIKKENVKPYSLYYLLVLCNSVLTSAYFINTCPKAKKGLFPKILVEDVRILPIFPIQFLTDKAVRQKKLKEFYTLYMHHWDTDVIASTGKFRAEIFSNGQMDIIHDILDYLSRQMLLNSYEIKNEMNNFLIYLERETKTKIDALNNKTKIKNYDLLDFDSLLDILKDNKIVCVSKHDFQKYLNEEFINSQNILKLLKQNRRKTESLIDNLIYDLYQLTEAEKDVINQLKSANEEIYLLDNSSEKNADDENTET